jgi:hypothetical protein
MERRSIRAMIGKNRLMSLGVDWMSNEKEQFSSDLWDGL